MLLPAGWESCMTSMSFTEQENAVIELVSRASGGMVQTSVVDVHKTEGGTVPTLRFTLEDVASTDLERARIAGGAESAETLANIVVLELRRQISA